MRRLAIISQYFIGWQAATQQLFIVLLVACACYNSPDTPAVVHDWYLLKNFSARFN